MDKTIKSWQMAPDLAKYEYFQQAPKSGLGNRLEAHESFDLQSRHELRQNQFLQFYIILHTTAEGDWKMY